MCVMAMLVFSLRATEQVASKGSTLLRFLFFFFRFRVDKIVRDRRVYRDSWDSRDDLSWGKFASVFFSFLHN